MNEARELEGMRAALTTPDVEVDGITYELKEIVGRFRRAEQPGETSPVMGVFLDERLVAEWNGTEFHFVLGLQASTLDALDKVMRSRGYGQVWRADAQAKGRAIAGRA
jgi:hypothetical protein